MKSMTVYDSMFPAFRVDPFELLEQVFETEPFFAGAVRTPAVDVREEEGRYLIEAELPGLSEKDLKLELKDGVLELSTTKKEEARDKAEEKGRRWIRRERRDFAFSRSFALPEDADGERIEARFKDGLLTIELPKKPETAPRTVPVKVA